MYVYTYIYMNIYVCKYVFKCGPGLIGEWQ